MEIRIRMCKFKIKVTGFDNLLHCHVELPHVLDLAVHLVNFLAGWVMGIILRHL